VIKQIIISAFLFVTGLIVAFYAESFLRGQILNIYTVSTQERIQFVGKNFYVFTIPLYYLSVGTSFMVFYLSNRQSKPQIVAGNALVFVAIVIGSVIVISYLDATMKVMKYANRETGLFQMSYGKIKHGSILTVSIITSMLPGIVSVMRPGKIRQLAFQAT